MIDLTELRIETFDAVHSVELSKIDIITLHIDPTANWVLFDQILRIAVRIDQPHGLSAWTPVDSPGPQSTRLIPAQKSTVYSSMDRPPTLWYMGSHHTPYSALHNGWTKNMQALASFGLACRGRWRFRPMCFSCLLSRFSPVGKVHTVVK